MALFIGFDMNLVGFVVVSTPLLLRPFVDPARMHQCDVAPQSDLYSSVWLDFNGMVHLYQCVVISLVQLLFVGTVCFHFSE